MARALITLTFAALLTAACTAKSAHVQKPQVQQRFLITMADTDRPYQSLGYLQMTRKGADMLGWLSVVDADLDKMLGDELIRELERRGADGIINLRFKERQWTTGERILFLIPPMILIPLPTRVEISGELVRFTDRAPALTAR
jgi:hypothetical protein